MERERQVAKVIVVMGVSGSGKSTVGRLLAERLGWVFADADDNHSPASVAKLRRGEPLEEQDRLPWLRVLRGRIDDWLANGDSAVLACSALTRRSRDLLRGDDERVAFVHLTGSRAALVERLARRQGHFMPADLLDDQLATLEPPTPDEALEVDLAAEPEAIVDEIIRRLALEPRGA